MLGFDAISQSAISDVPMTRGAAGALVGAATLRGIAPTATASTANGLSIVAGAVRNVGVVRAAGNVVGAAIVQGQVFLGLGSSLESRNQLFDFSVDVLQALIWQYNRADALQSILEAKQAWYDANQESFWENWYRDVFDIRTANDFGCAVWSIILAVPLNVQYGATDGKNFGFAPYQQNFYQSNFAPLNYEVIPLTIEQKRLVLQLRYYQLITRGAVPDINTNFARIFAPLGPAWVIDNLDMTMTYIFNFHIPSQLAFILKFYNLLPRPAGVRADFFQNGQSVGTIRGAAVVRGANNKSHGATVGAATVLGKTNIG